MADKMENLLRELKENNLRVIYLSGPISSIGFEKAKSEFDAFEKLLFENGFITVSTFSRMSPKSMEKSYYFRHGVKEMVDCDAVLIVGDNSLSVHSKKEVEIAEIMGIPIYNVTITKVK